MILSSNECVKVIIRVRPADDDEEGTVKISEDHLTISIESPQRHLKCSYDFILPPEASQDDVYTKVEYIEQSLLDGFNATVLTYGQTGSGKSYTMFGCEDGSYPGIVIRLVNKLFASLSNVEKSSVVVSFLQIHNENVYDLFDSRMKKLTVHEKNGRISVSNLSEYIVADSSQCKSLIQLGLRNRTIASTTMNHVSSRSHAILQITIEQQNGNHRKVSKLNLVDLAGSERFGVGGYDGDRVGELTNINSSLSTLGRCIAALSTKSEPGTPKSSQKSIHVPYRDSKLTRILQDSLGGNSKTVLLATINPSVSCAYESISTLRFADRAKNVIQTAFVNEEIVHDFKTISDLQHEVKRLKGILDEHGISYEDTNDNVPSSDKELEQDQVDTMDPDTNYNSNTCQRVISLIGSAISLMEGYLLMQHSYSSNIVPEPDRDIAVDKVAENTHSEVGPFPNPIDVQYENQQTDKQALANISNTSLSELLKKRNSMKIKGSSLTSN